MNDVRGEHTVYLNVELKHPQLASENSYLYDLDMHGSWRTRPGIDTLDGKVCITLNDDDQFHLYRQVDVYTRRWWQAAARRWLHPRQFSQRWRTRARVRVRRLDSDGGFDLIVGTPRHGTVPVADESGLPWSKNKAGAAVLPENKGTNQIQP